MNLKCKKTIVTFLSLTLGIINIFSLDYNKTGEFALQAEGQIEVQDNNSPTDIWDVLKQDIKTLTRVEKQKTCFEVFGSVLKCLESNSDQKILLPESLHELNVLCGEPGTLKNNLRMITDRTLTTFGSISFANILSNPTVDLDLLKNRQNFIRALLEDQVLYNKVNELLLVLQASENSIFNLWSPENPLNNEHANNCLYFKLKGLQGLNKSPKFLEFQRINSLLNLAGPMISLGQVALGLKFIEKEDWRRGVIGGGIANFIFGVLLYPLTYKAVTGIEHLRLITQRLMIDVANSTKSLKELAFMIKKYNFVYKNQLLGFAQEKDISQELQKLLDLLKADTFNGEASLFSLLGRSLTAYKYMSEIKEQFLPALQALGEIDALFSIAKLIKEHENKPVNYCLVNFVNSDTPVLEFKNGWNPLISPEVAVSESMAFNKSNIPNLLLTGPHGSGKSCFMRGCMYMALMAQTFGAVPASSCDITVFNKLSTYLNIKEDYSQNLSTFMAERKRVDIIKNIINNLKQGEFSFVVMDEVFKGTMEQEGAKRVYNFGKEIAKSTQSICLMATHFNYPTILEKETDGKFINYHVGLQENTNGQFKRLFKLVSGKNEWWFGDADKRDRFIEWLQIEA